jgi:signal transduction histidine kinase
MNRAELEANVTLEQALRRANLLAAAAEASQAMTRILDIDELLPKTVDIICDAYGFYYAGVFLIDEAGEFAILRAGRGEPGRIMMENNHKLSVGGNSMIGACTALNEARISLDVDSEKVWYFNPVLPETRSEMALPLAIGNRVIGAVTVQSVEAAAFSEEDISSLQAMANQLAIAIDNARQRRELEETHAQLLRAKTYEAIATATGDAIHWIGNKAEPIRSTVGRIRSDIQLFICAMADILRQAEVSAVTSQSFSGGPETASLKPGQASVASFKNQPLAQLILKEAAAIRKNNQAILAELEKLNYLPIDKLERRLSLNSMLEDLQIIDDAATLIMKIKEDLIGPAREQAPRPTMVDDVAKDAVHLMQLPPGVVRVSTQSDTPLVLADPIQLNRVFTNLLKNAYEAMENQSNPRIHINIYADRDNDLVKVDISDNGKGMSQDDLDKIWITFHTTKGVKGHTGLGLAACRLILEQTGGSISATSKVGEGSTFTVNLPVYQGKKDETKGEPGRGKILIIDDDDGWRNFAASALNSNGYKVSTSGKDYQATGYHSYDLILVDDILAERDSLDIFKAIREARAHSKTIAVSSNPRVERTKERMLLGIHDLVPKPYVQKSLLGEVAKALSAIH